jgi:hypothetical protein
MGVVYSGPIARTGGRKFSWQRATSMVTNIFIFSVTLIALAMDHLGCCR